MGEFKKKFSEVAARNIQHMKVVFASQSPAFKTIDQETVEKIVQSYADSYEIGLILGGIEAIKLLLEGDYRTDHYFLDPAIEELLELMMERGSEFAAKGLMMKAQNNLST